MTPPVGNADRCCRLDVDRHEAVQVDPDDGLQFEGMSLGLGHSNGQALVEVG